MCSMLFFLVADISIITLYSFQYNSNIFSTILDKYNSLPLKFILYESRKIKLERLRADNILRQVFFPIKFETYHI